jgi:DNA-binding transcriptional MerR regulator
MDIAEVTHRTGLSNATLHHYEQLGLITSTGRAGLRRQYDPSTVDTLAVIMLCQRSGFTLAEIGTLLAASSEWKQLALEKLSELDRRIEHLQHARAGLQHALSCPNPDIMRCEHFRANLTAILPGTTPT